MAFVDDLTLILDLMILVAVTVFYTGFFVWVHAWRKDAQRALSHLREGSFILAMLGGLIGVIALWGEFTWPLPGAYNLYFFDPLIMLALLLVAFGTAVTFRLPTHFVGMLGVVIGSGVIYYGSRAYWLGLTKEPFETLLLYLGFGAMAILSYPATLFVDWFVVGPQYAAAAPLPSTPTPAYPKLWTVLLGLFLLVVVLAGIAALLYGFSTAWSHLESPP
jgi:putative membrane protein